MQPLRFVPPDFRVPPVSPQAIEFLAWQLRQIVGQSGLAPLCSFGVVAAMRAQPGPTRDVDIRHVADGRLGMEGCLTLDPPVIWLEARVYTDAERGGPLGRDVVLHELAHLILHAEPLRQFHADAYVPPEATTYTAGCEWQAIRLSTAFAMPPAVVERARDARALARISGMPFKRASYRFARYRGHADRDPRQFRLF